MRRKLPRLALHVGKFVWLMLVVLFVSVNPVKAATIDTLSLQTKLVNTDGTNVTDGNYPFRFLIYTVNTGGTSLWSEDQTVSVTDGIVSVSLGSVSAFPTTLFDNNDLYIQVCLNGNGVAADSSNANCGPGTHAYEEVFSTRKPITSVPFSRRAVRSNSLIDGSGNAYTYNSFFINNGNTLGGLATLGTNDTQPLAFETNGLERMRILSNGNVGIGTNNPATAFEVNGVITIGNGTNTTQTLMTPNLGIANEPSLIYETNVYGIPSWDGFLYDVPVGNNQLMMWGTRGNAETALVAATRDLTKEVQFSLLHNTVDTDLNTARQFMFTAKGSGQNYQGIIEWQYGASAPVAGLIIDPNPSASTINNVILPNGNVGVGMTLPSGRFKFEVNGDIGPFSAPTATTTGRTITTLDNAADVGQYTSIKTLEDGRAVIAYYDVTNGDLKVTLCTNEFCTAAASTTVVDSTGNVGQYTSMAIGSDGFPVISYYDVTNLNLKVIKCGNAGCTTGNTITTLDSTGDVGQFTSIAIGRDNTPIIAYYNVTGGDLKVVKCGNTSCSAGNTITSVDTTNNVGQFNTIAIASDGFPIIVFQDVTNLNQRVVNCGNPACSAGNTFANIDSTNNVGYFNAMTMTPDGFPFIASYDATPANLNQRRTKCTTTSCSAVSAANLETTGTIGQYNSVDSGPSGFPVIAYYDASNGDLKVQKCGNALCSAGNVITAIDTTGNVGQYTSMSVSIKDGRPVIAYYDVTNTSLKVIKCTNSDCTANGGVNSTIYTGGSNLGSASNYFNNVYAVRYWAKEGLQISNFDLAEDYEIITPDIEAGELVMLADGEAEKMQRASGRYNADVMGVVSTKPAIRLTDWEASPEEQQKMRPIALSGRVPVKVTNENGDIKKGDRLVSSSTAGYAMKACGDVYCESGMSVGIALEDVAWVQAEGENVASFGTVTMFVQISQYIPEELLKAMNALGGTISSGTGFAIDTLNPKNLSVVFATAQNLKSQNLSIGEGALVISDNGDLTTKGTIAAPNINADRLSVSEVAVGNTVAGRGMIKAGDSKVTIPVQGMTEDSIVIATLIGGDDVVSQDFRITVISKNGELMVHINKKSDKDIQFNWVRLQKVSQ
jgi:hypothetical protein